MKATIFGAVGGSLIVLLAFSLFDRQTPAFAQRAVPTDSSSELITLQTPIDNVRQELTVIDPKARVISIYHVELPSGSITLKSVRNIYWDMQMVEFNGTSPLPREIRSMLETR